MSWRGVYTCIEIIHTHNNIYYGNRCSISADVDVFRARLAFESVPELDKCDTIKLDLAVLEKYPLVLPSTQ